MDYIVIMFIGILAILFYIAVVITLILSYLAVINTILQVIQVNQRIGL